MNIREFVRDNRITIRVKYGADEKAHARIGRDMNPWTVTLRYGRRRMTVPFFTGSLSNYEPDAPGVLDCLVMDARGYDRARGFERWASEYGYDTDSRSAEATYKQVERQARELRQFLGDAYDVAMECEGL